MGPDNPAIGGPGAARRRAFYALVQLLPDLFGASELRRWVHYHLPPDVSSALPSDGSSEAAVAHGLVVELERRGLADDAFFTRLIEHRGNRRGEIEAVQIQFREARAQEALAGGLSRESYPSVESAPSRSRARLAAMLGVGSLGFWTFTRCYPSVDISRAAVGVERGVFSFLPLGRAPHSPAFPRLW